MRLGLVSDLHARFDPLLPKLLAREGGMLIVNPGSAGPKRFSLPRTAGTMTLARGRSPRVKRWDLERDRPYPLPLTIP